MATTARTRGRIRPRILIAHRDHEWVDQARSRLEQMGYLVTECYELDWVPDILGGSMPIDLALISNEMDPNGQANILDTLKKRGILTKLVLLLDDLDDSMSLRGSGFSTFRIGQGIPQLALFVASQLGLPPAAEAKA